MKTKLAWVMLVSLLTLVVVVSLLFPGCLPPQHQTPTTPSPTVSLPSGADLTFEDYSLIKGFGLKHIDNPAGPQIYTMVNKHSQWPDVLQALASIDQENLDNFDYSRYFLLFVFMGVQPWTGPSIQVRVIRQVQNTIFVLANFDKGGPTYQPLVSSPARILKVDKKNLTLYGEFTLVLLDLTGVERARTTANITN